MRSGTVCRIGDGTRLASWNGLMPALLKWTIAFFILALIAAVLGFGGIAGAGMGIAQILFVGFLIVAIVTLVLNFVRKA